MTVPPVGDPAREASHALGGYLYQIHATAVAWARLRPNELLSLEIAEDYAIAADNALEAVQVKATKTPITSSSEAVVQTIDSFFQLRAANLDRSVRMQFLTTASIGRELRSRDRIGGKAALSYWAEVQAGAPIAPLRQRLQTMPLGDAAQSFVDHSTDADLRNELVRRIDWRCGAPTIIEQTDLLRELLVYHGDERGTDARTSLRAIGPMVLNLLKRASGPIEQRSLHRADFLTLFDEATRTSLSAGTLDAIVHAATQGASDGGLAPPSALQPLAAPMAPETVARDRVERRVDAALSEGSMVWLTGGAGLGKTTLAQRCAQRHPGDWRVAPLRNLAPDACANSLRRISAVVAAERPVGIVLDDLAHASAPGFEAAMRMVVGEARRGGVHVIATGTSEPTRRVIRQLRIPTTMLTVANLRESEVGNLVSALDGDPDVWAQYVYHGAIAGHPQLAHALALGLAERGWPINEFRELSALRGTNEDVNAEREAVRQRLMNDLPDGARRLLYRLSVPIGSYERPLALALATVEPVIPDPGEALDRLLGPWVDRIGHDALRTSSLLSNSATVMLGEVETKAVHRTIATFLTRTRTLDADRIPAIWTHGLIGEAPEPLNAMVVATLLTEANDLPRLAEAAELFVRMSQTESLYPPDPLIASNLRLVQVLLAGAAGDEANFTRAWARLETEMAALHGEERRYDGLLIKLLMVPGAAEAIPDLAGFCVRVRALLNTLDIDPREWSRSLPDGFDRDLNPIALLFEQQVASVRSMNTLERVVGSLEQVDPADRAMLLAGFGGPPELRALAIREPWMLLFRARELVPFELAQRYRALAARFVAMGANDLAFEAYETAVAIYSEDHDAYDCADETLAEAVERLGDRGRLTRTQAKLAHHRHDYARQLEIAARVDPSVLGDVEAAFLRARNGSCRGSPRGPCRGGSAILDGLGGGTPGQHNRSQGNDNGLSSGRGVGTLS